MAPFWSSSRKTRPLTAPDDRLAAEFAHPASTTSAPAMTNAVAANTTLVREIDLIGLLLR